MSGGSAVESVGNGQARLDEYKGFGDYAAEMRGLSKACGLQLGDVVAGKLRSSGFSDAWIVAMIAAMPVVELRGAIPIGALMGLPLPKVFALCVAGNMAPILPLLLALRSLGLALHRLLSLALGLTPSGPDLLGS